MCGLVESVDSLFMMCEVASIIRYRVFLLVGHLGSLL